MSWETFLKAHRGAIAATGFFRVEVAGIVRQPNGDWMKQMARNLTDADEGFLNGTRTSSTTAIRCLQTRSGSFSSPQE